MKANRGLRCPAQVIHDPNAGRPGVTPLVCNFSEERTWVKPSVLLPLRKVMLSAWRERLGTQSENQAPLSPYCFQVRFSANNVPTPPSVAVFRFLAIDSGIGLPCKRTSSGL